MKKIIFIICFTYATYSIAQDTIGDGCSNCSLRATPGKIDSFAQQIKTIIRHNYNPTNSKEYCAMAQDLENFQSRILSSVDSRNLDAIPRLWSETPVVGKVYKTRDGRLYKVSSMKIEDGMTKLLGQYLQDQSDNRIAWQNPSKGMFGFKTGLCWWHSRMQLSLNYLTQVEPDAPPLTEEEAEEIIDHLIDRDKVVSLRGFKNINEFTKKYQKLIHKKMQSWMSVDSIFKFQWAKGLQGTFSPSAKTLKKSMDKLYHRVHDQKLVTYQMLQTPGIDTHAWLVGKMEPIVRRGVKVGYTMYVIDSNHPAKTIPIKYMFGDKSLKDKRVFSGTTATEEVGSFVPYTQRDDEQTEMLVSMLRHCHPQAFVTMMKKYYQSELDRLNDPWKRDSSSFTDDLDRDDYERELRYIQQGKFDKLSLRRMKEVLPDDFAEPRRWHTLWK